MKNYYKRSELANLYLMQLGMTNNNLAVSAGVRMGKTMFVLRDLIPLANELGMQAIYVDLGLVAGDVAQSINQSCLYEKDSRLFMTLIEKAELKGSVGGRSLKQLHKKNENKISSIELASIRSTWSENLKAGLKHDKKTMIVIDNADVLTNLSKTFELLVLIKELMVEFEGCLNFVFLFERSDSSVKLFQAVKSPLTGTAHLVTHPNIGKGYPEHLDKILKKHGVAGDCSTKFIPVFQSSPYWVDKYCSELLLNTMKEDFEDKEVISDKIIKLMSIFDGEDDLLECLGALECELLNGIMERESIYSKGYIKKFEKLNIIGTPSRIQKAVDRLMALGLVHRDEQVLQVTHNIEIILNRKRMRRVAQT
jgi:hypothetical protein